MEVAMELGSYEAKSKFSEVLEVAERGEEVIVTRRGKKVVRIQAYSGQGSERGEALAALDLIRASRPEGRASIQELIDEGRR
jgi:prevent-host-death family protein